MHMITSQIKIWNYDNFGAQAGQRHSFQIEYVQNLWI